MKFNSRVFWKLISIFVVMDLCWIMAGCADWESQASSIIALLGPAIQALIAILAALGIGISPEVMGQFNNWAQQAQTALVTLKGLIAQAKTATSEALPGILNQIQSVIGVVANSLSTILPELHITNTATQARVIAAFSAVSAFFTALIALVPDVSALTSKFDASDESHIKQELALHSKAKETAKQFKHDFNEAVEPLGKQYMI